MDLFLIKTDKGYIKYSANSTNKITLVTIDKASVYNEKKLSLIKSIMKIVKSEGFNNPRIAKLSMIERDYYTE